MGNVEFLQLTRIIGTRQLTNITHPFTHRNSGSQMSFKIGVLKYFPVFTRTPPVAASVFVFVCFCSYNFIRSNVGQILLFASLFV